MARPGLTQHRKFRRLERTVGSHALARGLLETMWDVCYQNGDPFLGDSDDVEAAAHWDGEPGKLSKALLDAGGGMGAGFIEEVPGSPGQYQVHDLYHHAPDYVRKRRSREAVRRAKTDPVDKIEPQQADTDRSPTGQRQPSPDCQDGVDVTCAPAPAPAPAPALKTKPSYPPSADAARVIDIWNQTAAGTKLPRAKLTDKRGKVIRIRLKNPSWLEEFRIACAYIRRQDFYLGNGRSGWVADLNYLLRPDKVTELAEKARANGGSGSAGGNKSQVEFLDTSPPKPNPEALRVLQKAEQEESKQAVVAGGAQC